MLAGELSRSELPAIFAPNQLVIRFPIAYNRQYLACSDPLRLQRIEECLTRVTGKKWLVRCEVSERESGPAIATLADVPIAATEKRGEPLFEKVQMTLGARLLKVDDGFGRTRKAQQFNDEAVDGLSNREEE